MGLEELAFDLFVAAAVLLTGFLGEADKRGIGDSTKKAAVGFCFGGGNILEHDFIQHWQTSCAGGDNRGALAGAAGHCDSGRCRAGL